MADKLKFTDESPNKISDNSINYEYNQHDMGKLLH